MTVKAEPLKEVKLEEKGPQQPEPVDKAEKEKREKRKKEKEEIHKKLEEKLAEHGGRESDIPMNSDYWQLLNSYRSE